MSGAAYLTEYSGLAASLPGLDLPWLQGFRNQALQTFAVNGFPGNREEEWAIPICRR